MSSIEQLLAEYKDLVRRVGEEDLQVARAIWYRQCAELVAEALAAYRARVIAGMDATPEEFRAIIQSLYERLESTEQELAAVKAKLGATIHE